MVRLDVGDHGNVGAVAQQGGIRFIGFRHKALSCAVVRVGSGLVELTADGKAGVHTRRLHGHNGHGGGGGFSVGTGKKDLCVVRHEVGKQVGAPHDGNPMCFRGDQFRVILRDCGEGNNHHVGQFAR